MKRNKYHFFSLRTAIRYHVARQLDALGWQRVDNARDADFGDEHLTLNDDITQQLEYKHFLAQLIQKHHGSFIPLTYPIDDETYEDVIARIIYDYYLGDNQQLKENPDLKWILKPGMLNNADHIKLFDTIQAVKQYYRGNPFGQSQQAQDAQKRLGGPHVLQQYIVNPALINGRKFTFRIHVFVTNFGGIYLYHRGYMNISAVPYDRQAGFDNKKMHITNYMLDGVQSHITQQTTDNMPGFDTIYAQMKTIITQVFKALMKEHPDYLTPPKTHHPTALEAKNRDTNASLSGTPRFEILGVDFMQDAEGKLWLIEMNQGPDMPMYEDNPLKPILWEPFWEDVIKHLVLPIANHTAGPIKSPHFQPLLTRFQCYSPWRVAIQRLLGHKS